ncbi:hypothetical protein PHSY_007450 [Pseudozyma hubeiensis SY62]|uniref:Uncharacterized protein n=1 Tax=Pseudozyma hubeiensis (strain SY62) TaxID=1305764 RepID=R9PF50_PSEHS|nr:hypothetical protein PHSY_007450 [Pseudozyma hubeiensis SY62]GAC99847.1 hypothetical protein PHSY_007450 [Pseudozyma hubeiensis SY62]
MTIDEGSDDGHRSSRALRLGAFVTSSLVSVLQAFRHTNSARKPRDRCAEALFCFIALYSNTILLIYEERHSPDRTRTVVRFMADRSAAIRRRRREARSIRRLRRQDMRSNRFEPIMRNTVIASEILLAGEHVVEPWQSHIEPLDLVGGTLALSGRLRKIDRNRKRKEMASRRFPAARPC